MLRALIDSFTASPAVLLGACPSLPLLGGVRQALATALTTAVKVGRWANAWLGGVGEQVSFAMSVTSYQQSAPCQSPSCHVSTSFSSPPCHLALTTSGPLLCLCCFPLRCSWQATAAVHGLVVAAGQLAAACPAAGVAPLQQWDLLLLLNLLGANESFRHSGEAMTPVCLPRFNSGRPDCNAGGQAGAGAAVLWLCGGSERRWRRPVQQEQGSTWHERLSLFGVA